MEVFPIVSRPLATIQDIMINVYLTTASRINFDIKEILVRLMLRYKSTFFCCKLSIGRQCLL